MRDDERDQALLAAMDPAMRDRILAMRDREAQQEAEKLLVRTCRRERLAPLRRGAQPGEGPVITPGAFTKHQGNGEHTAPFGERGPQDDDADPAKPRDPPWRGRAGRRSSSPAAMSAFRDARRRRGWSVSRAAGAAGVSRPHMSLMERGYRRPSASVAEAVIAALGMTPAEAAAVRSVAVRLAGRDSPYRDGWRPAPYGKQQHEERRAAVLGPRRTAPQARQEPAGAPEDARAWDNAYAPDSAAADGEPNSWAEVYGITAEAQARQRLEGLRASPWRR